ISGLHALPCSLTVGEGCLCRALPPGGGCESCKCLRSGSPARRQRQLIAERVLLVEALLVVGNTRQTVLGIEQGFAVSIRSLDRIPVLLHEFQITGDRVVLRDRVEKVIAQVDVHEHVGVLAPLHRARALRQLVPDHAGLAILIFENELELLASALVTTGCQQSVRSNHSIAGEEPIVLRTASLPRWTIACDLTATEIEVADPRLLQCYL